MLSHLDAKNQPAMVNVGDKAVTRRTARATATVALPPELARLIAGNEITGKKGPLFQTAKLAGVMGAKKTSDLIPLCHPLALEDCQIDIAAGAPDSRGAVEVTIDCRVSIHAKTGVEMEALTGASVAALTLYDMGKAVSHGIVIKEIRLREKTGGKKDVLFS
jgi:cyclic pyranopterin phosphate synthase